MNVLLNCIFKLVSLARYLINHLSHPVMSYKFFSQFVAFNYYVIDRLINIPIFITAILLPVSFPINVNCDRNDSKSPQISVSLFSIQADIYNTVSRMVLILPLISISSSVPSTLLWTVLRAPITTGITVPLMCHSFLVLGWGPSICQSFHLLFVTW